MAGYSVNGVGYGSTLFALGIGLWSYYVGRNRLEPFPRAAIALFLTLIAAAPYPLGFSFSDSSHAMVYNRYGYALLGLILVESFEPFLRLEGRQAWTGGTSSGAATAVLLFLKANFFSAALVLLACSCIVRRPIGRRLLGVAAGFAVVTFAMLVYLRFGLGSMMADLRMAAGARLNTLSPVMFVWNARLYASFLLTLLLLGVAASFKDEALRPKYLAFRLPVLGALAYGCDIVLLSSNQQGPTLPMIAIVAILSANAVVAYHRRAVAAERPSAPLYPTAIVLFAAAIFLPQMVSDAAGTAYGVWSRLRPVPVDVRFQEPHLTPLLLYNAEYHGSNGGEYTTYVNEGAALLQSFSSPTDKVMTLDMTNPFPYTLRREPPRGGIASAAYDYTVSDAYHPSDAAFFGNADIVMVPKHPALNGYWLTGFQKLYEPGLHQRFALQTESDWWWLYRKR
jgi:hypothetical protein